MCPNMPIQICAYCLVGNSMQKSECQMSRTSKCVVFIILWENIQMAFHFHHDSEVHIQWTLHYPMWPCDRRRHSVNGSDI